MSLSVFEDEDWLDRMYRKSESDNTRTCAKTSLTMFEYFCTTKKTTKIKMIQYYQELFNQNKPDIRRICLSLDNFIQFLNEDHDEIILNKIGQKLFKKKSPKTIKTYFSFLKSYLRQCHGIRITTDDVKDYIQFPKQRREQRRPLELKTVKKIMNYASPARKALYYTLISSGMRIGECLALRKKDFHLNENPVRITLEAEITKTKESRETYISNEALEKLKSILEKKQDNDLVFSNTEIPRQAINTEEAYFLHLREKLGLTEKYPNSTRFIVNIHAFRAYFHTKASQKHGSDYANALDGHSGYLKQYYRLSEEDRAKKYKELESELFVESIQLESEKKKDKIIEDLQKEMSKMQDAMIRANILNESGNVKQD
ncbi:site-specific integrase [Nitrosopumilus sp. b3]|uniref:tyrosine-type recombinase/integrase n=1 Tax=Nitrosopumilus sp. b3 TaxID=2109909 RepID=UPI0015F4211C|nr:site-specific integrase [Nitrosopumilus sp. b3]